MTERIGYRATFLDSSRINVLKTDGVLKDEQRHQCYSSIPAASTAASKCEGLQSEDSNLSDEAKREVFLFTTPGGSGARAVRSSKKLGRQVDKNHELSEGSPMQWSPVESAELSSKLSKLSFNSRLEQSIRPPSSATVQRSASAERSERQTHVAVNGSKHNLQKSTEASINNTKRFGKDDCGPGKAQSVPVVAEQLQRSLHVKNNACTKGVQFDHASGGVTRATQLCDNQAASASAINTPLPAGFVFSAQVSSSPSTRAQRPKKSPTCIARSSSESLAVNLSASAGSAKTQSSFSIFSAEWSAIHSQEQNVVVASDQQPSSSNLKLNLQSTAAACGIGTAMSGIHLEQPQAAVTSQPLNDTGSGFGAGINSMHFQQRAPNVDNTKTFVFGQKNPSHTVATDGSSVQQQTTRGLHSRMRAHRKSRQKTAASSNYVPREYVSFVTKAPRITLFGNLATNGSQLKAHEQCSTEASMAQELAASRACEMYRNEGNEAFKKNDYHAAHELYTKAIKALWSWPSLHSRMAILMSNRAAALLSLGKPFLALKDCQMGLNYDPKYTRCALRIATCHYRLGDFAAAKQHLQKMKESAENRQLLAEVNKKLDEVIRHQNDVTRVLLHLGHSRDSKPHAACTTGKQSEQDIMGALTDLQNIWTHIPHAEYLHAAKAQALLRLGRYSEAIEACNVAVHYDETQKSQGTKPWQLWIEGQSKYHDGNYSAALQSLNLLLQQCSNVEPSHQFNGSPNQTEGNCWLDTIITLPSNAQLIDDIKLIETAQRLRLEGNELMKNRKFEEAAQRYTEALAVPKLSAAFVSILYSNRAAALQGLSQWLQAIADCCRSKALVPSFAKAQSRLASLFTELRMYDAAVQALQCALHAPDLPITDRQEYSKRLQDVHRACKQAESRLIRRGSIGLQPDYYKLLILDRSCSTEEVRRAYKRLALQLHPDKVVSACKFTSQLSESGSKVLPVLQALDRLQQDAKWLFQCLGDAHHVLLDQTKRQNLDYELGVEDVCGSFGRMSSLGKANGTNTFSSPRRNKNAQFSNKYPQAAACHGTHQAYHHHKFHHF